MYLLINANTIVLGIVPNPLVGKSESCDQVNSNSYTCMEMLLYKKLI